MPSPSAASVVIWGSVTSTSSAAVVSPVLRACHTRSGLLAPQQVMPCCDGTTTGVPFCRSNEASTGSADMSEKSSGTAALTASPLIASPSAPLSVVGPIHVRSCSALTWIELSPAVSVMPLAVIELA
jgi:hypothetical protein